MTKQEKIIAAYNCINDKLPDKRCEKCPYGYGYLDQTGDNYFVTCNTEMIMADAIALLKAQEPMKPVFEKQFRPDIKYYKCGKCGTSLGANGIANYCMFCGRAVKWDGEDA